MLARTTTVLLGVGFVAVLGAASLAAPRRLLPTQVAAVTAPALQGDGWINVPAKDLARVKLFTGRVTVVHFWTFECINCRHNLPYYAKWAAAYKPEDVQVIGVHTPELETERVPDNVRSAVKAIGITYPVLIDGEGANWNRYHQEVWPTVYVIDKKGQLRYKWVGELQWDGQNGYGEVTKVIEALRKE